MIWSLIPAIGDSTWRMREQRIILEMRVIVSVERRLCNEWALKMEDLEAEVQWLGGRCFARGRSYSCALLCQHANSRNAALPVFAIPHSFITRIAGS